MARHGLTDCVLVGRLSMMSPAGCCLGARGKASLGGDETRAGTSLVAGAFWPALSREVSAAGGLAGGVAGETIGASDVLARTTDGTGKTSSDRLVSKEGWFLRGRVAALELDVELSTHQPVLICYFIRRSA